MGKFIDLFLAPESSAPQPSGVGTPNYSTTSKASEPQISQAAISSGPSMPQANGSVAPSGNMVSALWQTIIEKNLPGPDYLELKNTMAALDGMPLSDQQKVESAFRMIKQTNPDFTMRKVIDSIDQYIKIVEDERSVGIRELAQQKSQKIDGALAGIESMRGEERNIQSQIDALMKQKSELSGKIAAAEASIETAKASIEQSEKSFTASVETVIATLVDDKTKYQSYNM